MPTLSVIMPTYKENLAFLEKSVSSVMNQTFKDFEFIITTEPEETNIDFLEKTADKDRRIKILKNRSRLGVAASRNNAILESKGEYVALVDSDDYYDLNRFEKQMSFLEKNPLIDVVGSNIFLVDENNNIIGERLYPEIHDDIKTEFLMKMAIANPSVITRKKDLTEVGLFNKNLTKAEDFDLWLRFLVNEKKIHNLQDKLVYYRTLKNDNQKRGYRHYRNYYNALKEHSKFIWPFHQRFSSLFIFYIVSHLPNYFLDYLLNLQMVKRIKNIKRYNS